MGHTVRVLKADSSTKVINKSLICGGRGEWVEGEEDIEGIHGDGKIKLKFKNTQNKSIIL